MRRSASPSLSSFACFFRANADRSSSFPLPADQLAWLSDRYPDKGRCRSAASAAKLVWRRNLKEEKQEATAAVKAAKKPRASVKEKKPTSEPKTKIVKTEFKSAEMISSSDEEDDE